MNKENIHPSFNIKTAEEKAVELKEQQEEANKIKTLFESTFSSRDGIKTLRYIMDSAGIFAISAVNDPSGSISEPKTFINEGKRLLCLQICKLVSDQTFIKAQQINLNNKD